MSVFENGKSLKEDQRKDHIETHRGECERVIIVTGHHIRNLKGGSAFNARCRMWLVTYIVINKSGSRGRVGHRLKEGGEGFKSRKNWGTYAVELVD